jgi:hypothetical protein
MPTRHPFPIALAIVLLAMPCAAALAQDSSLAFTKEAPRWAPSLAAGLPDSGHAQKTFFTRHDLVSVGAAAAVTGAVMVFDEKIGRWWRSDHVQGSESLHKTVSNLTRLNETPLTIASIVTYGVGRLAHSETAADVGLHWTEALIFTDVISQAIRGPLGRARPRVSQDNAFDFHYFQGFTKFEYRSFPSLHAAVGFATAASLVGELRVRHPEATWYVAPVLYTFAMIPGVTRMYLDQHWASDVVMGSFIGQLIGDRVVYYAHTHKRTKFDRALLAMSVTPDSHGGTLVLLDVQKLFGQNEQP